MDKHEAKREGVCKPDKTETLDWGNSQGIAAPSETARPLMDEEGYVATIPKQVFREDRAAETRSDLEFSHEFQRGDVESKYGPK